MMNPPVLSVRDVSKEFGPDVRVLEHVDLEVVEGETLVLIGESGSGKTTLLRMFNALTHPSSGEVRIHGEPIRVKDPIDLRRHIGYVQQDAGLLPHWTVEANVGLVPLLLGWEPERRMSRMHALLDLVHLDPQQFRARYPIELSGGTTTTRGLCASSRGRSWDRPARRTLWRARRDYPSRTSTSIPGS